MAQKKAASAVEEVRVFLHGAEIKRRMVMDAAEGKNTAVFAGLPQDVRPESINASIEKGGTLISADFEMDSFKEPAVSKELEALKERYEKVKDAIKELEGRQRLLSSEEKFLDGNRKIGGNTGSSLKDLKDAEEYFKGRKEEISASWIEADKKLGDLKKEQERITKEMGSFPANAVRYSGKITVEFHSESKGEAEITVSYYVNNAWWRPFHEIRMNEVGAPVTLSMKGNIVQNTGEDWKDVKVRLSTGNPTLGNQQPTLYTWHINLIMPQPVVRSRKEYVEECQAEYEAYDQRVAYPSVAMSQKATMMEEMAPPEPVAQVTEAHTTTEFALPAVLDIPSSNKPSKVEISKHILKAEVFYYCVSKLDTDAFLIARIGGWESLNLLAGEVSIFQGNEYVGKTYLNPATAEDGMEISLGRDKGIIVTRDRGNDMTAKGMIGKNKKVMREWIITVRNTRNKEVKMKLVDQIPISINSDLIVNPVEISGAELNKETGILTWSLDIPSGGSVKKVLKYEVTYPKTGTVYLD
jgi:uncharacterized protein (TIGR02231 family)